MKASKENSRGGKKAQGTSGRARRLAAGAWLALGSALVAVPVAHAQQAPAAAPAKASEVYAFRPGVWLDPGRGVAYMMVPGAAVAAVDLGTGRELWRQEGIEKPLWATRERLLAQRMESPEAISLVLLDVSAASPRELWRASYRLPEGVRAAVDDGRSSFFDLQACSSADEVGLEWTFDEVRKPTAPDAPVDETNRRTVGTVRVGLLSGRMQPSAQRVCDLPKVAQAGRSLPVPGTLTESGLTVRYASADGKHYLASGPARASGEEPQYMWEIYSSETGARVARLQEPWLAAWFVVRDGVVIHDVLASDAAPGAERDDEDEDEDEERAGEEAAEIELEPPALRAVRIESGAEVWRHDYRNTHPELGEGEEEGEEE